eukprot:2745858-Rhodomonas_salina.1
MPLIQERRSARVGRQSGGTALAAYAYAGTELAQAGTDGGLELAYVPTRMMVPSERKVVLAYAPGGTALAYARYVPTRRKL